MHIGADRFRNPYEELPRDFYSRRTTYYQALDLTRPINWELNRQQCDEMVKYATALRLGSAQEPRPPHN
jgi:hypothetical protein